MGSRCLGCHLRRPLLGRHLRRPLLGRILHHPAMGLLLRPARRLLLLLHRVRRQLPWTRLWLILYLTLLPGS
jgi:hypothetical protein